MTDQFERDLTALLHDRADGLEIPHPHLDRLQREGRARQTRLRTRRTVVAAVAAAAVVVAVAVPLALTHSRAETPIQPVAPTTSATVTTAEEPPTSPSAPISSAVTPPTFTSVADLPQGAPATIPATTPDGALVVGGTTYRTWGNTYYHLSWTAGAPIFTTITGDHAYTIRGGKIVPFATPDIVLADDVGWALSPDGTTLYLATRLSTQQVRLDAYATATGKVTGTTIITDVRQPSDAKDGPVPDVSVFGADDAGRLFLEVFSTAQPSSGRTVAWWPPGDATEPGRTAPVTGLPGNGSFAVTPGGLAYGTAWGVVDDGGAWGQQRTLPKGVGLSWSADGGHYLRADKPVVTNVDKGTSVTLPIPVGTYVTGIGFEDDDHVLLVAKTGKKEYLVRCGVTTAPTCERISDLGKNYYEGDIYASGITS